MMSIKNNEHFQKTTWVKIMTAEMRKVWQERRRRGRTGCACSDFSGCVGLVEWLLLL